MLPWFEELMNATSQTAYGSIDILTSTLKQKKNTVSEENCVRETRGMDAREEGDAPRRMLCGRVALSYHVSLVHITGLGCILNWVGDHRTIFIDRI